MSRLLDVLPEPVLLLDRAGGVIHANPAALGQLVRSADALLGRRLHDIAAESADRVDALLRQGWRSSRITPGRLRLRLPDGRSLDCRCELVHVGAADGHPPALLVRLRQQAEGSGRFMALSERIDALSREVARRRTAEAALREQSDWLQVVLRSIGDAVIATDVRGHVVFMNPVAERLCGWQEAQAHGQPASTVFAVCHGDRRESSLHPVDRVLRERRVVGLEPDAWLRSRDGTDWPIDDAAGPIFDSSGHLLGVVVVFREISVRIEADQARRMLERQLRDAQKMEAIGALAGGIAHDFNNVLAAILGNVDVAREAVDPAHPVAMHLGQIDRAGRRARELVRQILAFSRRQPQALQRVALQPLVHDCAALMRGTLPPTIELALRVDDAPLEVLADATQIGQVLLNLVTNAWHALPRQAGRITVAAEAVQGAEPDGLLPGAGPWSEERQACLSVTDDGCGMDVPTMQRIFEPFFTTKPTGQGTGLGLSVTHGIVAEHRGRIAVRSAPGEGTRFAVYLPLVAAAPAPAAVPSSAARVAVDGAGRRVLYVDDDEIVRLMMDAVLRRDRFDVRTCPGASAALGHLTAAPDDWHVLVTDFNMPGMTGLDLLREVRRLGLALPVVIVSGYLSDDLRRETQALGSVRLMSKEDSFEALPQLIDELLAGR